RRRRSPKWCRERSTPFSATPFTTSPCWSSPNTRLWSIPTRIWKALRASGDGKFIGRKEQRGENCQNCQNCQKIQIEETQSRRSLAILAILAIDGYRPKRGRDQAA